MREQRSPRATAVPTRNQLQRRAADAGASDDAHTEFRKARAEARVYGQAQAQARGGPWSAWRLREEAAQLLDSVQETIRIGEEAGIPVQITHHKVIGVENWGASVESLRLVDEARARGVDVTIDQYPYTASQTSINALIPQWAQAGGREEMLTRINQS